MTYIDVLFCIIYLKFSMCAFCSIRSCIVAIITHIHQQMHIIYIKSVTLMSCCKSYSTTWDYCNENSVLLCKHWGSHSALDHLVIIGSVVFEGLKMTR